MTGKKELKLIYHLTLIINLFFRMHGYAPTFDDDCKITFNYENSVFPPYKEAKFFEENYMVLTDDYKILEAEMSWITFGKLILRIHGQMMEHKYVSLIQFTKTIKT